MPASVTVFAPAKVNLALHVGLPRADGRHPLQSVVAFADVGDVLRVTPGGEGAVALSGPFAADLAAAGGEGFIARAFALGPGEAAYSFALEKNLPVASGIGGGSADAAAALRAANHLNGWGYGAAELARIGLALGADVPVCVESRPAFMEGTGEILRPIALAPLYAVLANPGVPVSTAAVFRAFDARPPVPFTQAEPPAWESAEAATEGLKAWRNDLQPPARALCPPVGEALDLLAAAPGVLLARMSGSGATCFALVETAAVAASAAAWMRARRPSWWISPARLGAVDAAPRAA